MAITEVFGGKDLINYCISSKSENFVLVHCGGNEAYTECKNLGVLQLHRLQLSRNLWDSPRYFAIVPCTGRLYYSCIVGPG